MARNIEIMKGTPVWFGWKVLWAIVTPGFMIVRNLYYLILVKVVMRYRLEKKN